MTPDGATSPFVADNPSQIAAQNMSLYEMCKHAAVVKDPRELVSLVSPPRRGGPTGASPTNRPI